MRAGEAVVIVRVRARGNTGSSRLSSHGSTSVTAWRPARTSLPPSGPAASCTFGFTLSGRSPRRVQRSSSSRHDAPRPPAEGGSKTMPKVPKRFERIDALFVQNASSFTSDGKTMTLHRLADATVYFADRPLREAGQVLSRRFVELWDEDDASGFAAAAPTAVLAFVEGA